MALATHAIPPQGLGREQDCTGNTMDFCLVMLHTNFNELNSQFVKCPLTKAQWSHIRIPL